MTLFEIKAATAAYLGHDVDDLTVNGVDLGLAALNQVRLNAELNHDFEFSRKLLTVSVNGVTGGSLDDVVIYGTDDAASIKTIVDIGTFDDFDNLIPTEWSTVSESLARQRAENPMSVVRVPTDAQATSGPCGQRRFLVTGDTLFYYPKVADTTFDVGIEAYTFTTDWVDEDLLQEGTLGPPWTTRGHQYLLWAAVSQINNLFKEFVFRQEGNLPPPDKLAEAGLQSLISWDIFRFEQFRRHGR